jgi:hypothetical protein
MSFPFLKKLKKIERKKGDKDNCCPTAYPTLILFVGDLTSSFSFPGCFSSFLSPSFIKGKKEKNTSEKRKKERRYQDNLSVGEGRHPFYIEGDVKSKDTV